jgi:hypothetical protein
MKSLQDHGSNTGKYKFYVIHTVHFFIILVLTYKCKILFSIIQYFIE